MSSESLQCNNSVRNSCCPAILNILGEKFIYLSVTVTACNFAICSSILTSAESRRRLRSASSADLIVPATRRTTMGAGPRLRRRSTARLAQSAGRDPSQLIDGHLQTISENSLLFPVLLLTLFFITFIPTS